MPRTKMWFNHPFCISSSLTPSALIEFNGVLGYLTLWHILFLYDRARALPSDGVIVEIGSFAGLSAIAMSHGLVASDNNSARIYCVDPWKHPPENQNMSINTENLEYYEWPNFTLLPDVARARDVESLIRLGATTRLATIKDRLQLQESLGMLDNSEGYDLFKRNISEAGVSSLICPVKKPSPETAAEFADSSIGLIYVDGDHSFEACYADLAGWCSKLQPGGVIIGHDCLPGSAVHRAVEEFTRHHGLTYSLIFPAHDKKTYQHTKKLYMFEIEIGKSAERCCHYANSAGATAISPGAEIRNARTPALAPEIHEEVREGSLQWHVQHYKPNNTIGT